MTTPTQQTSLERPVVQKVYFAELQFASGTARLSSVNFPINWGGFDWIGLGGLGDVSGVEESESLDAKSVQFTLNAAQSEWLTLAISDVDDYRGKIAKLYFCPMTENFLLVDTPEICWRGIMDTMTIGIDGEEGSIILKCETSAYALRRRASLRLNAAQHKRDHPSDTGLDYLTDLIAHPQIWLTKKFQMQ